MNAANFGEKDPPDRPGDAEAVDFARYLRIIRRHWVLLILLPAIGAAAAWAVTRNGTPLYDATTKLLLNSGSQVAALLNPNSQAPADPDRELNTNVALINQTRNADAVRHALGLSFSDAKLLSEVSTSTEPGSNIVDVTIRDEDPRRAAAIANTLAGQYIVFRQTSARADLAQAADLARRQLALLSGAQLASAQGKQLQDRLRELQVVSELQTSNSQVIQDAVAPTRPSRPRPKFWALVGGLLGLIGAIVVMLGVEFLDRRIKDEEGAHYIFRQPLLGEIPRASRLGSTTERTNIEWDEAYRTLAANLRFFKLGRDVKSLLITSPGPQEGKTSVTLGLAKALADLGQRVVAIECDLRRPTFARYLELPPTPGLSAILAGLGPRLRDELIKIDVSTGRQVPAGTPNRGPSFAVVPAGTPPPNPQRLLSANSSREILDAACASFDVVLLDTAPLGTVSDALSLAGLVDGIAVVIRLGTTRRDAARRARRTLANLDVEVLGTVFVATARRRSYEYYGYSADLDREPRWRRGSRRSPSKAATPSQVEPAPEAPTGGEFPPLRR